MPTDDELRAQYGANVLISRSRGFALVHLDAPGLSLVRERTRVFDPDEYFEPDCPLCAIQRIRRVVVFDELFEPPGDDEEILLDD
jgi:hypothetical protein